MSTTSFPGYLYAKSLLRDGEKSPGYSLIFVHDHVRRYEREIRALQDSFEWSVSRACRYTPVVAYKRVDDGVLVVRFFDEGEDAFKRPHTIRVEGALTGIDNFSVALNCSDGYRVCPEESSYEFLCENQSLDRCSPEENWKFVGEESSYSCAVVGHKGRVSTEPYDSAGQKKEHIMEQSYGSRRSSLVAVLVVLLLALVGFTIFQHFQKDDLSREIRRVRADLRASEERVEQLQKWVGNRQNFERNVSNMREIFSALKKSVAEAESLMLNIDGASSSVQRGTLRAGTQDKDKTLRKSVVTTNVSEKVSGGKSVSQDPKKEGGSLFGGLF